MRTVSFSANNVRAILANEFISTYSNTTGSNSAGGSFAHAPNEEPGYCQRGIGKQNVQVIFTTPEGNIFHVATGYLPPEELFAEISFALRAFKELEAKFQQTQDPELARQHLVSIQTKRMMDRGYSQKDLAPDILFANFGGFGPQGPVMINQQVSIAGGDPAQGLLADAKYVLRNPLIHCSEFERDPGGLVGNGQTFFGSKSSGSGTLKPFGG